MTDDDLEALRADLARHTGTARTRPLITLGNALAERYWRVAPGTSAGEPYLNEAIHVIDEAYGYLEPGQFLRGQVASQLGWLIGNRHAVHGGPEQDRERGIRLLEEALTFPQLPQMLQTLARLVLGQLLLSRAIRSLQSGDSAMRVMRSGLSGEEAADADRAVECFRQVVDGPAAVAESTVVARMMLTVAEGLRALAGGLGGGLGSLDITPMIQALAALQNAQQQGAMRMPGYPLGFTPSFLDADKLGTVDPIERPVAVVDGAPPATSPPPPPQQPAKPPVSATTLRAALLGKLPGRGFAAILSLLSEGARIPAIDTVDELVALGSSLVEAPGAVGTDHLLLAVTLYLRSRVDGGGWGDNGADDTRAAGDSLLAAAVALVAESADAVAVAFRLATVLDERLPVRNIRTRLSEAFETVTEALRQVGADGLIYPTSGDMLLLSSVSGRFEYAAAGSRLPARVLVAGDGPIPDEPTVSYVGSGAQVVALANRTRLPLTESAVFVANPRRDRKQATLDALVLRRTFYVRSTGLGETAENGDGVGTPDEVRARLNASMLHLGCGVSAEGGLELAGPAVLNLAEIASANPAKAGGLAVLPPTPTGAATLTEALLASRFVGVIGFRDPVPDHQTASLIYLLLHAHLVDEGRDPASAVKEVRCWMADPHRKPPDYLPTWCETMAADADMADPAYWGTLIYSGV